MAHKKFLIFSAFMPCDSYNKIFYEKCKRMDSTAYFFKASGKFLKL